MAAPIYFAVLGQGLRLAVSFVLNFAVWWSRRALVLLRRDSSF